MNIRLTRNVRWMSPSWYVYGWRAWFWHRNETFDTWGFLGFHVER